MLLPFRTSPDWSWTPESESWNDHDTEVRLRFADPFTPKEAGRPAPKFEVAVVVRAEKWNEETRKWEDFYFDGQIWEERKLVSFETGLHPTIFDDQYVRYSTPLNRQRYFLQDEVANQYLPGGNLTPLTPEKNSKLSGTKAVNLQKMGGLYFKQNMDGFFPSSDRHGSYEYALRFRKIGAEDITVELPALAGATQVREINFVLPELENESLYALQLVRKNTRKNPKTEDQEH